MALTRQRNLQIFLSLSLSCHQARSIGVPFSPDHWRAYASSDTSTKIHGRSYVPLFRTLERTYSLTTFLSLSFQPNLHVYLGLRPSFSSWLTYLFALRVEINRKIAYYGDVFLFYVWDVCTCLFSKRYET